MKLLDKLEKKYHAWAIPRLTLYLIGGQVLLYFLLQANPEFREHLALYPNKVLQGEVYRLVTFLFMPFRFGNPIWAFFAWYIFYLMGTALESRWGAFRYNAFIAIGYLATIVVSFLVPNIPSSNAFLYGSVFLAFAFLYPDFQLYIFFILPVKIKWLALVTWIGYFFAFFMGGGSSRLLVLAAVSNFLLFFGKDILLKVHYGRRKMHKETQKIVTEKLPFHKCAACGVTDKTHPKLEFRYCSDCEPVLGYCPEHIAEHEHKKGKGQVE